MQFRFFTSDNCMCSVGFVVMMLSACMGGVLFPGLLVLRASAPAGSGRPSITPESSAPWGLGMLVNKSFVLGDGENPGIHFLWSSGQKESRPQSQRSPDNSGTVTDAESTL